MDHIFWKINILLVTRVFKIMRAITMLLQDLDGWRRGEETRIPSKYLRPTSQIIFSKVKINVSNYCAVTRNIFHRKINASIFHAATHSGGFRGAA